MRHKDEIHVGTGSFCLLDMRQLTEGSDWDPILGWKCCKLDDAIKIARRKLAELGPFSVIDGLFG